MSEGDNIKAIIDLNDQDDRPPSDYEEDPSEDIEEIAEQYELDEEDDEIGEPIADDDSLVQLSAHKDDVLRVCVSDSARWMASGSIDDTAIIWDLDSESLIPYLIIEEHSETVDMIAFNAKSTILASGDSSGKIICTNVIDKTTLCEIDDCSGLEWLFWHPIADILFAGSSDGLICMWLIGSKGVTDLKSYGGLKCKAARLLTPDYKVLMAVYEDGLVRFWDLKTASNHVEPVQLNKACLQNTAVDIHPSRNLAAIGDLDGRIAIINLTNFKLIQYIEAEVENITSSNDSEGTNQSSIEVVKFSPEQNWLAVGTTGGLLVIYNMETGQARYKCKHDETVVSCIWRLEPENANRIFIVSACYDGAVRAWDAEGNPKLLLSGGGPTNSIFDFCLVKKNDESRIFTACTKGIIRVFNWSTNC